MATTPTPRSYTQALGDLIDGFRSKQGVRALRVGGGILSTLEAAARGDLRSSQDIFNLLNSIALDKATGLALDRIGADESTPRLQQAPATGTASIGDSSFTKISTTLFQGLASPIVGTTSLNIADGSGFPNTGAVYLGRGTPNYEGPISYSSVSNAGTHWVLTLSSGTTNFHNASETVIVAAGGNRVIGSGTVAQTPQANVANAVQFRTLYKATIPDGETLITGVTVVALLPGIIGNVIAGAIKEFVSPPFSGATVTNPSPFSNGIETELDDPYRERIRAARKSRQTGTSLAITNSVLGIVSPDENKRVTSSSVVRRVGVSTLYIDDGTGYEEQTLPVAIETLVDSAIGGEQDIAVTQRPIAKAFIASQNVAPFPLISGAVLSVLVGGETSVHSFDVAQFASIGNASAFEVVASINANPNLTFSARTVGGGTQVVLFAKADINEDIEVVASEGIDANAALQFPIGINHTVQLYKNDRLLTKDGQVAAMVGNGFSQWNAMTGTQNLQLSIDGTPALTFTFTDQSFIDAGTGYNTLGRNSIAAWIAVINAAIPGITATEDGGRIVLTSNAGASNKASVQVLDGSSLVTNRMFTIGFVQGAAPDFTLNRNSSQITLTKALAAGDRLSIGSLNTRAFAQSSVIPPTTLASTAKMWFVVDGAAQLISTGVNSSTTLTVAVLGVFDWGSMLTLTASAGAPFTNLDRGDWVVLWDPALNASLQGAFRIANVPATNQIVIERRQGQGARVGHRTVALPGVGSSIGKILTTGGCVNPMVHVTDTPVGITDTCEVYDPNTKLTTAVAPMSTPRVFHTLTLLADGTVLATGGMNDAGQQVASIEIYNPTLNTWTTQSSVLTLAVSGHQATLLGNNSVLITGGLNGFAPTSDFLVYNPSADTITTTGSMTSARAWHKQTLLPNGNVLIVGGYNGGMPSNSAELWLTSTLLCTATGSMTAGRQNFGLSLVGTSPTTVIAAGNEFSISDKNTYEIYTISTGIWSVSPIALPGSMSFENKDLVRLTNGNVVGINGWNTAGAHDIGFTWDGTTMANTSVDGDNVLTAGRWNGQYVELKNGSGTVKNIVCGVGGATQLSTTYGFVPSSIVEYYTPAGDTYSVPEPALGTVTLTAGGAAFVRTTNIVREVDVPAASNYTSSTFASVVNGDSTNPGLAGLSLSPALVGAAAVLYQTNRVRITTNTHATNGDIALVTQTTNAAGFGLTPSSAIGNLTDHVGSVESQSELGTPSMEDIRVRSNTTSNRVILGTSFVEYAHTLVGLKDWWSGSDATSAFAPAATFYPRSGSNGGFRSRVTGALAYTNLSRADLRLAPIEPLAPLDRFYRAAPFAIGPSDDLTVTADNDIGKRFSIKMYRALAPVGNTYAQTNAFTDADASASLLTTFGAGYDFNDFAVYMAARAVAFSGDSTRSMLFRYTRLGPDGDGARVRFGNPIAPSTPLNVSVTMANDTTDVTVVLASGALRGVTARGTTSIGQSVTAVDSGEIATIVQVLNLLAATASRTSNVTTITTTLPTGVTDHGLAIGNIVWLQSTSGSFGSGAKTITGRTATTFTYADVASNASDVNIGSVSFDSVGRATFQSSSTAVNDWLRISASGDVAVGATVQISAVDAGNGYVTTKSGDQILGSTLTVNTVLSWTNLGATTNLQVMQNTPQTATAIVAAVNALAAALNSTCPITAKILGAGSGTIAQNTPDSLDNQNAWYTLADGQNWVASVGTSGGNYTFTFKKPITGSLSASADWQDEVVHLVPSSTKNVVDWLNSPTVTGLWTVCSIQASSDGQKVQIASLTPGSAGGVQVQGGLSNSVTAAVAGTIAHLEATSASTVKTSDTAGLCKGLWCRVDNATPLPITSNFGAGLSLVSWGADGLVRFSAPIVGPIIATTQGKVRIERQGKFVVISDMGMGQNIGLTSSEAGVWVRLTPATSPTSQFPQISSANQGIYRVLRAINVTAGAAGAVVIENDNSIDESVECDVALYTLNGAMPGETFVVNTPIWGEANQGTWTIKAVGETTAGAGDQFAHYDRFTVDISSRTPAPQGSGPALTSTTAPLVYLIESQPSTFVLKVDGIAPNQTDGSFSDVRWDITPIYSAIGAAAGSVITALDKLQFPTAFASGADGYRYDTGLIGEANKVIYGDPADTATYPGQASDGANINISGPLVKRVTVSLLLRVRSGVSNSGIADRVRSAVATVINQTGIGQAVALSAIIAAASKVVGVISVTIVSPAYGVGNDLIPVQANEKPLVLNLATDIGVTFSGV
jgi:hypothetical protein